jgi:predicted transcriptional regulator
VIGIADVQQESLAEERIENAVAVAAVERTIESSESLRAELLSSELAGRAILSELHAGMSMAEAVLASGRSAVELRAGVQRQLDTFLESRRRVRLVLIDACLGAGMTRGRIAQMLGVTRQRVTVLAKDLACDHRRAYGSSPEI